MDNVNDKIEELTRATNLDKLGIPEATIMFGLGAAVLLFGYRLKKIAFFIIWFILGFNLMGILTPFISSNVPVIAESELYQALLPIAGGILLALMGFSIEKLCVGGICFVLIMLVVMQYFGTEMQYVIIGAVVGVLAAGFAVMMMKPATIIATAVAGAYALTLAIMKFGAEIDFDTMYWPILLGLAAVGAVFQFVTTKRLQ